MTETDRPLLRAVPEARTVRAHLGVRLRELRLLRRLLRLAEAVDDHRAHDVRSKPRDERAGGAA